VGRIVLIDALGAAGLLAIWYYCLVRYNRRKGAAALHAVEAACHGKARVTEARWLDVCQLQARLSFATHLLDNSKVTIRLFHRPMPIQWLISLWRKQRETVTFEADLDYVPGFQLEVFRHRWVTHKNAASGRNSKDWTITRPGPIVLTTKTQWTQELTPVVNTLITSRGQDLLVVRFRTESPHLVAVVGLDALSDEQGAATFLGVMRDLAAGASTSHP
jgi:hypothetical protein